MSLEDAARWVSWLPPDAVTWIAVRERQEQRKPVRKDADGKTVVSDALKKQMRELHEKRAREVQDMAKGGGDG